MAPKAWYKLLTPESRWDKVSLEEVEDVIDLKDAVKARASRKLNAYDASDLILKATRKIDDASQGVELDERKDLASVLKEFEVEFSDEKDVQKLFADNIWLFVDTPTPSFTELEKKRKAGELLPADLKKKKWTVNGAIRTFEANSVYYVDPAENEENQRFLASIKSRQLLMLMGARASGQTTRLYRLMTQLAENGYRCFMVSLKEINVNRDTDIFWTTLGRALRANYDEVKPIGSSRDFLDAFAKTVWKEQKIVIFFDEFDKMYNATDEIRNECLETFRAIRNNNHLYGVHSIVACGTFSIRHLNSTDQRLSPFNVSESLKNPYFSLQQTQRLFDEYARDEKITIDHDIVNSIHAESNGHPGMVCLCGRAIAENLRIEAVNKNLAYKAWQDFSITELNNRIHSYRTFRRMADSLFNEQATNAVNLLRSYFIGFLDDVPIEDKEKQKQADFLTAEGVLLKPEVDGNCYHMASALIDSFIRRYIISEKYPNAPSTPVPKQNGYTDILEVIKESLQFFDKDIIKLAPIRSYKQAKVNVDGCSQRAVPRESVYDTELMRILVNWLVKLEEYTVNGQWHLIDPNMTGKAAHKYCDVVIKKPGMPTVVLELLATGDETFVQEHIDKTPLYKELLSADEAWVVHFTREDGYLKHALWQSPTQLNEGINMIHIWHNEDFTIAQMSARWKDVGGNIHQIDDQPLAI